MEELFDFSAPAEVYTAKRNSSRAQPVTYKRFSAGSEAIQYVMESLQADKLSCTVIEAGDERYDGKAIQALYESKAYPLTRAKV